MVVSPELDALRVIGPLETFTPTISCAAPMCAFTDLFSHKPHSWAKNIRCWLRSGVRRYCFAMPTMRAPWSERSCRFMERTSSLSSLLHATNPLPAVSTTHIIFTCLGEVVADN